MKSRFVYVGIVLVVGLLLILNLENSNKKSEQPEVMAEVADEAIIKGVTTDSTDSETQIQRAGAVDVEISLKKPLDVNERIVFELTLNTHSVNLDYDYIKISELTDNLGNIYQAREWTGESEGHHLSGDLIFEALSPTLEGLELTKLILKIDGIDGELLEFNWNIGKI